MSATLKNRHLMAAAFFTLISFCGSDAAFAVPFEDVPATAAAAAKVLDLRDVELPKDVKIVGAGQVGQLTYEVHQDPKAAFEFHRSSLLKAGWKELPGSTTDVAYANGMFSKSGFTLSCSTSSNGREGADAASFVSVFNYGNVPLDTIPVINGATSMFSNAASASYVADASVPDAADQMMTLLKRAGWKFYGTNPLSDEQHFLTVRKNAIQLSVMVVKAPAQGNKTMISFSSLVLAAEIPAPDTAEQVQFDGQSKTLRFASKSGFEAISKFYVAELTASGWKPGSEKLTESDDEFGRATARQVFRNSDGDIMSIEMRRQEEQIDVTAAFMTKQDLLEAENKARQTIQIAKAENEKREADSKAARETARKEFDASSARMDALANSLIADALGGGKARPSDAGKSSSKSGKTNGKTNGNAVTVQVPAGTEWDSAAENVLKVTVDGGKGRATAESIAENLETAGWKTEDKNLTDSSGNYSFAKDNGRINLTFVDTGFTRVTMMIIGVGVELAGEVAADESASKAKAKGKSKSK